MHVISSAIGGHDVLIGLRKVKDRKRHQSPSRAAQTPIEESSICTQMGSQQILITIKSNITAAYCENISFSIVCLQVQ